MVKVIQHEINRSEIGSVGIEQDRLTGDGHGVLDAFRIQRDLLDPANDVVGAPDGRGVRQLDVHQQIAFVLSRNEPRRRRGKAPPGQA